MEQQSFKGTHVYFFTLQNVPYIVVEILLLWLYPMVGLGLIITIPVTFLINTGLSLITCSIVYYLMKHTKQHWIGYIINVCVIVFTIFFTIYIFPQEYGGHVFTKILEDLKKIL